MFRDAVERILAHRFEFWRLSERYDWRRLVGSVLTTTAVTLAAACVPLPLGSGRELMFASAVLLLAALQSGALAVLLSTCLVAAGQAIIDTAEFVPWVAGASALLAGLLMSQTRAPAPVALLVYCVLSMLALLVPVPATMTLALQKSGTVLFASVVNFSLATSLWTLLPRRSFISRQRQRRYLSQAVFSWALGAALLPALVMMIAAGMGVALPAEAGFRYVFLCTVVAAVICTWLSHKVGASFGRLGLEAFEGPQQGGQPSQRARLRNAPAELADLALTWRRHLLHGRLRARRTDEQIRQLRSNNEKLRSSVVNLTHRLQEQSQTLLLSQKRDTQQMKQLEESLRQANATIEKIKNSQILFIATMSHEVRTPLHGLMSTLSLLREETLSEEGVRRLSIARTSARSLLQIANDILDLSRIEAGGFSLEFAAFNPRSLVREVVEEFQATAQSQRLQLDALLQDDLPRALLGDKARTRQIISNLITNALKFTARGSITLRVAWRDEKLVIDVIDTGEGVPADKRKVIFDAFVQIESVTNRRFTGTGLGLTIGRHLAEAMGGSLTLHSTGREGSTFRLELPLRLSDEPLPEDQSARVLVRHSGHVLVVEDNDANQYVARVLLESLGCNVTLASSGKRALQLVQEVQFDLVFMDCQLPGMDGAETCRRMRTIMSNRVPIIAMTANALPETKASSLQAGMDDFLAKPFTKSTLSKMLSQWLPGGEAVDVDIEGTLSGRSEPVLDESVFEELWESLHWRIRPLQEIYDAVVDNVRKMIDLLDVVETLPPQKVLRSLHTVRGSASMVGARRLTRIVGLLEYAARQEKLDRKTVEDAQLSKALRELQQEVDQRLSSYTSARPV